MMYSAWMIPGMYPRIVNRMLIKRSAPHPLSRNTPRGGRTTARMILQISLAVKGMVSVVIDEGEIRKSKLLGLTRLF